MALGSDPNPLHDRDPGFKDVDIAAISAIAQAAIDVELFTIPLYMTSLYSIQGMHQITSQGNDFYKGRLWPGPAPSADPKTANEKAFNIIFSVFIQEMLHLQLASNIATAIGVTPTYTGPALQNADHGWICYGPTLTVIPYIIDLKDTKEHKEVVVNIGPVSEDQLKLFLAIEEPEKVAKDYIDPDKLDKYFPKVPFANWEPKQPLPMFGTIGWMYQCYKNYLDIEYSDGSTLWEALYSAGQKKGAQQNDMFNNFVAGGHPMREFMGFESTVALTYPDIAKQQIVQMMNAITDQGEGATLKFRLMQAQALHLLQAVAPSYQSSQPALESDYPSFSDTGELEPSADAKARYENDKLDHYERFQVVASMLPEIVTWPQWLASHGPWKAEDLQTPDYEGPGPYGLPTTHQTADALNAPAHDPGTDNYRTLTQASIGAIAGVTTVLNDYWNAEKQAKQTVLFPMPSMGGSGDRMAICWAVFGKAPDLSIGLAPPAQNNCATPANRSTSTARAPTIAPMSRSSTPARAPTIAARRAVAALCKCSTPAPRRAIAAASSRPRRCSKCAPSAAATPSPAAPIRRPATINAAASAAARCRFRPISSIPRAATCSSSISCSNRAAAGTRSRSTAYRSISARACPFMPWPTRPIRR
jgi:hypothetical protein